MTPSGACDKIKRMKKLSKILSNFKKAKILVVGDLILDEFIWGDVERISPEAPVPVVKVNSQSFMPGGASNVANNINALGAEVYLAGVIGDDLYGTTLKDQLAQKGIHTGGLVVDKARPTTLKTRVIAHNQQVVRIDRENEVHIKGRALKEVLAYARGKIKEVDAVVIEDYGKGIITPQLLKGILRTARTHKKILNIDPKEEHFSYYRGATTITPNRSELEKATLIKIKNEKSLEAAANKLLKKLKLKSLLVTLGEEGMRLFQRNKKSRHIPTMAEEVYDVSGAGDTVISAFTLALASKAGFEQAAYISNCAASVVVSKIGVAVCTVAELKKKLTQERRVKKS